MREQWRPVKGYRGYYEVSSLSRVRSVNRRVRNPIGRGNRPLVGRVLREGKWKAFYPHVVLCREGVRKSAKVHSLVMAAFVPRPRWATEVNHRDGDKTNCSLANLEWSDGSKNKSHAYKTGLRVVTQKQKAALDAGRGIQNGNTRTS